MADQPVRRAGRPPSTVDGRTVPERLLGVARKLFAEKGFEGTSVQDVVAAAGVTKGALYHYFGSKDELLYEIYGRVLRMQTDRLEEAAAREGPIAERVHAAAADVVVTTMENLESTTIFFRSLHQLSEEKRKEVRRERRRYHQTFRAMIEEGQASGVFRDDIEADLIVDYFFGSVHHLPMWWKPRGRLSEEEIGRSFADLLLSSLTVRRPA
ncbi:transcriptional regulator [Frankia sp. EI5c]|uniref:TetR/AcrR family transcriptional regulator n=1 Tax=Frankia sp. EI5c TaxID=683316 RepID=UPI0007C26D1A|nr:TetR/AcrR family transcriptional regulator [Frankia sp. EI5c]OAA27378.1 transcriptional regulator [Frankia sp. EI5c]